MNCFSKSALLLLSIMLAVPVGVLAQQGAHSPPPELPNYLIALNDSRSQDAADGEALRAAREMLGPPDRKQISVHFLELPGKTAGSKYLTLQSKDSSRNAGAEMSRHFLSVRFPAARKDSLRNSQSKVRERTRAIPASLAEQIEEIWEAALLQARPPARQPQATRGGNYYFASLSRQALSGSPHASEPVPYALIQYGILLRRYAMGDKSVNERLLAREAGDLLDMLEIQNVEGPKKKDSAMVLLLSYLRYKALEK